MTAKLEDGKRGAMSVEPHGRKIGGCQHCGSDLVYTVTVSASGPGYYCIDCGRPQAHSCTGCKYSGEKPEERRALPKNERHLKSISCQLCAKTVAVPEGAPLPEVLRKHWQDNHPEKLAALKREFQPKQTPAIFLETGAMSAAAEAKEGGARRKGLTSVKGIVAQRAQPQDRRANGPHPADQGVASGPPRRKSSSLASCNLCTKQVPARGLKGHIRLVHGAGRVVVLYENGAYEFFDSKAEAEKSLQSEDKMAVIKHILEISRELKVKRMLFLG